MMILYVTILPYFCATVCGTAHHHVKVSLLCPFYKNDTRIDHKELVGKWMTVYTQPRAVHCFTLQIRATTDLEREQCLTKYGDFNGRVDWSICLLEVLSPLGKHYLQNKGVGNSGLLENIIVTEGKGGRYELQNQTADQWTISGRRGSELLLMRDCSGEATAVFVRAPYWPKATDLYAILHRSGVPIFSQQRALCHPSIWVPSKIHPMSGYLNKRRF